MTHSTEGGPGPAPVAGPEVTDVLVIDDQDDVRSVLERCLRRSGYSMASCSDGRGALSLLSSKRFHLVVTDIYMPGADGFEVIMAIGQSRPRPRVLAISGGTINEAGLNLKTAQLLGCDRVMAKPFDIEEFTSVVRDLIGPPSVRTSPVVA
jgi:two-component system, OmpR family, response regulator